VRLFGRRAASEAASHGARLSQPQPSANTSDSEPSRVTLPGEAAAGGTPALLTSRDAWDQPFAVRSSRITELVNHEIHEPHETRHGNQLCSGTIRSRLRFENAPFFRVILCVSWFQLPFSGSLADSDHGCRKSESYVVSYKPRLPRNLEFKDKTGGLLPARLLENSGAAARYSGLPLGPPCLASSAASKACCSATRSSPGLSASSTACSALSCSCE
jgi:hypothetical protein